MGAEKDRFVKKAAVTNWRSFKLTHRAAIKACLNEHDWTGLITARDGAARPGRVLGCWEETSRQHQLIILHQSFSLHLILSTCRFVKEIINCKVLQNLNLHKLFRFPEISTWLPPCLPVSSANINYKTCSVWQDNLQRRYTNALIMHSSAKWNIKPSRRSGGGWVYMLWVKSFIYRHASISQWNTMSDLIDTPAGGLTTGFCEPLGPIWERPYKRREG